jgi:patatin-like phospholipase/acyl hydrolase
LTLAVQASASTPVFFKPKTYTNGHGVQEVLVDGNIIADNPSLYAFILASEAYKQAAIRIISLGTGLPPVRKIDPNKMNAVMWAN